MMKVKGIAVLSALILAACAPQGASTGGPVASATQTAVTTDAAGRVVRPRAERNQDDSMGPAAFKGVSVLAWDQTVLLTGAVAKPESRRRAEQIAKTIGGVTQVFNDLVMAEDPAAIAFVPEVSREQRIYAGLLGADDITGAYVVRAVNGVVTLLGTARSAEDVARATAFAFVQLPVLQRVNGLQLEPKWIVSLGSRWRW